MKSNRISALLLALVILLAGATIKAQDKTNYLLFVRNDGLGAVGYLDHGGDFVQTQAINSFAANWNRVVSAENGVLFYRNDGLGAVGQIDRDGLFTTTYSTNSFSVNWTHIVSTGRNLLFYRNDGAGAVGHI